MAEPTPSTEVAPARPDVFLSYAREDTAFADRLSLALSERGKDVWIDVDDIRGGAADWRASVWAGIEASKVVVLVLTPDLLASKVCGEELARAVELNKRLVPVLRRPVDELDVPAAVEAPNWIHARSDDDFDASVGRLVDAIELDEAWVEQHARYTQRTAEWLRADRDASYLLRGSDLSAAERWLDAQAEHAERATAEQVTYITAGRRAAARRQRALLAGVGLALVAMTGLAIVALVLRATAVDRERTARAQARAAEAIAALGRDPEESVRRALQAVEIRAGEAEAGYALRRAVGAAGWTSLARPSAAPVADVAFSDGGGPRRVATGSEDGTVAVWDARNGRRIARATEPRRVTSVEISPDGRHLLTVSRDGIARTRDSATGRLEHALDTRARDLWAASYGAGGRRILTVSERGAQIWDAASGTQVRRIAFTGEHRGTTRMSLDGRLVLTPGGDGSHAWLWDVASGRRVATLRERGEASLRFALFSADGRRIATLDSAGAISVWNTAGARRAARLAPRAGLITDVDLSADGGRVVRAGADGRAEVWDVRRGRRIAVLRNGEPLVTAQFDRAGRHVVTGDDDGVARVWDAASGALLQVLDGHTAAVRRARFSPDGARVATVSDDGTARVWVARPQTPSDPFWQRADDATTGPDSRHVLVARGARRGVWDTASGRVVELRGGIYATDRPAWPCGRAAGCAPWSPDGRLVAGATAAGSAVVWDARSGAVRRTVGRATGSVIGAAFSPDGARLVVVDGERPQAELWNLAANRREATMPARGGEPLQSAQLSPDPLSVLTVDAAGVAQVSDPVSGVSLPLPGSTRPAAAAQSPDGLRDAIGTSHGVLRVFGDPGDPARSRPATAGEPVNSLAWDRGGSFVATGGQKGVTRIWDARTLRSTVLQAPGGAISGATFSPDARFVLVTSGSTTRLWDRALRRVVLDLPRTPDVRAELTPDGERIVLAGASRLEIRRCDACAPLPELVRRARALLPAP